MTVDHDFALVIGIKDYPHLRSLQGPLEDAKQVAHWLRAGAGLPKANVEIVVSHGDAGERPILEEVDAAFDSLLTKAKDAGGGRRLYVYFAGHGCSQAIDHLALIMANADEQRLNRAMNASEYRAALAQQLFPEQLYLFDCCRNYDRRVTGRGPEWTFDSGGAPQPGLTQIVLFAAGFTEYANERHFLYGERRGLFTKALVEGLNGAAATADPISGVGKVTSERLLAYVNDRVDDLTRSERVPTKQHLWVETLGTHRSLDLASGIEPWRRRLEITAPVGSTDVLVVDDHDHLVENRAVRSCEVPIVFELELTTYRLVAKPSGSDMIVRLLPDGVPLSVDLRRASDAAPVS